MASSAPTPASRWENVRPALALEQLAALERTAGGAAQVLGEQDVLVGERPRPAEEDDDGVGLVRTPATGAQRSEP